MLKKNYKMSIENFKKWLMLYNQFKYIYTDSYFQRKIFLNMKLAFEEEEIF